MPGDNTQRVFPGSTSIENVFTFLDRQGFRAHQPRHVHPRQQADNHNDVVHTRLQIGVQHQQQEEGRDRHQNIDGAHHQVVQPAAKIAADSAHHGANQRGKQHRQKANHQRDATAGKRAGKIVAAIFIGAKPVCAIGRQHAGGQRHLIRIVRTEARGKRRDHKDKQNQQGKLRRTIAAELVANVLPASIHRRLPHCTNAGIGKAIQQIGQQIADDQHQR